MGMLMPTTRPLRLELPLEVSVRVEVSTLRVPLPSRMHSQSRVEAGPDGERVGALCVEAVVGNCGVAGAGVGADPYQVLSDLQVTRVDAADPGPAAEVLGEGVHPFVELDHPLALIWLGGGAALVVPRLVGR